jgi:hypothetical protein
MEESENMAKRSGAAVSGTADGGAGAAELTLGKTVKLTLSKLSIIRKGVHNYYANFRKLNEITTKTSFFK